jgi:hypothetical protein
VVEESRFVDHVGMSQLSSIVEEPVGFALEVDHIDGSLVEFEYTRWPTALLAGGFAKLQRLVGGRML